MKPSADSSAGCNTFPKAPPPAGALTARTTKRSGRRPMFGTLALALTGVLGAAACNPYERLVGDYNAGAVDPIKFLAPYLGAGGSAKMPGGGVFQYSAGTVRGAKVAYYALPLAGSQANRADPLDLEAANAPIAYSFDPDPLHPQNDSDKCTKAEGYTYDRYRDAVRFDRQGNIFVKLPVDSSYVPIVQEVQVASKTNPCQDIKSEDNLITRGDIAVDLAPPPEEIVDGKPSGRPSGRFLLWALIDPAADVQLPDMKLDPVTGLGPQRWGWFQRYMVAYLDGGVIPTQVASPGGKLRMATQNLYFPTTVRDDMGMDQAGDMGMGLDILEFKRGEDGYSPVCKVLSFDPKDTTMPETSVAEIDPATIKDTGTYVYCIQAP